MANLSLLGQTRFDSGALSGLGAVVHRVTNPGAHQVTVLQDGKPIRSLPLQVVQVPSAPEATGSGGPTAVSLGSALDQLHVDFGRILASLGGVGAQPPPEPVR